MKVVKNCISTRDIAADTGINHVSIVNSIEKNMDIMLEVSGYAPIQKVYKTKTKTGKEYLLYPEQEMLFMLLANNVSEAVRDYKINLASNDGKKSQYISRDLDHTVESYMNYKSIKISFE
jgi:phage regulator Rha-like protein